MRRGAAAAKTDRSLFGGVSACPRIPPVAGRSVSRRLVRISGTDDVDQGEAQRTEQQRRAGGVVYFRRLRRPPVCDLFRPTSFFSEPARERLPGGPARRVL